MSGFFKARYLSIKINVLLSFYSLIALRNFDALKDQTLDTLMRC